MVQKVAGDAPVTLGKNDQARVWLESFYAGGKTKQIDNIPSSTDTNRGAMLGAQTTLDDGDVVFGVFTGTSLLNSSMDNEHRNNTKQNYLFTSLYHSLTLRSQLPH